MQNVNKELFRRASRKAKKKMTTAKFSLSAEDEGTDTEARNSSGDTETPKSLGRSVTGTIRSFARKSWIGSSSRPSSPSRKDGSGEDKKRSRSPRKRHTLLTTEPITKPEPAASRSSSQSSNKAEDQSLTNGNIEPAPKNVALARPVSALITKNKSETSLNRLSRASSSLSLRSKASMDRMPMPAIKVPPIPTSMSTDRLSTMSMEINKKKDPLWNAFRTLDGEHAGYMPLHVCRSAC